MKTTFVRAGSLTLLLCSILPSDAHGQYSASQSNDPSSGDIGFLSHLYDAAVGIANQFIHVVLYIALPSERIFWLYLLSSLVFALIIYWGLVRRNHGEELAKQGFLRFVFPEKIWKHPSAWLDVRYFFFHQMFRLLIYGAFAASTITLVSKSTIRLSSTVFGPAPLFDVTNHSTFTISLIAFCYMLASTVFLDFVSYSIHYIQHKSKFLWEFHKVHHSAEVLHPLSNYREHPIDNIVYALGTGVSGGVSVAMVTILLGYVPTLPQILGVSGIYFAFYFLAYNLRHSHIWLRWPGILAYLFGCPAHHQVHHSYHPDHINKNFAFLFPFWDALFGTFCLPENNEDVSFGLAEDHDPEYTSCLGLYFIPLRNALRNLFSHR